jgi:hypothetical protein
LVDGAAAVRFAKAYDVRPPKPRGLARRLGARRVRAKVTRTHDLTDSGRPAAGGLRYGLLISRDGGGGFRFAVRPRPRPISKIVGLKGRQVNVLVASVCDANGNCAAKRLGRFRAKRR